MAISRSAKAIEWMSQDSSRTQAEAARMFGIDRSVISKALKKRDDAGDDVCPCCGQLTTRRAKPGPKPEASE